MDTTDTVQGAVAYVHRGYFGDRESAEECAVTLGRRFPGCSAEVVAVEDDEEMWLIRATRTIVPSPDRDTEVATVMGQFGGEYEGGNPIHPPAPRRGRRATRG